MKLPQSNGNFVLERVLMEWNEEEWKNKKKINVGIPISKISLGYGKYLDSFIYNIDESKQDEKKPRNTGNPNFCLLHSFTIEITYKWNGDIESLLRQELIMRLTYRPKYQKSIICVNRRINQVTKNYEEQVKIFDLVPFQMKKGLW